MIDIPPTCPVSFTTGPPPTHPDDHILTATNVHHVRTCKSVCAGFLHFHPAADYFDVSPGTAGACIARFFASTVYSSATTPSIPASTTKWLNAAFVVITASVDDSELENECCVTGLNPISAGNGEYEIARIQLSTPSPVRAHTRFPGQRNNDRHHS